jgi:hypothetical protein
MLNHVLLLLPSSDDSLIGTLLVQAPASLRAYPRKKILEINDFCEECVHHKISDVRDRGKDANRTLLIPDKLTYPLHDDPNLGIQFPPEIQTPFDTYYRHLWNVHLHYSLYLLCTLLYPLRMDDDYLLDGFALDNTG